MRLPSILFKATIFLLQINEAWQKYEWKECSSTTAKCNRFNEPPLVVLSLVGFRNGYLDKKIVKTLDYLADCGAKAKHVYPSYPSKTLPNQYTMVTGLYPESHGIVDNQVYDTFMKEFSSVDVLGAGRFYGGEPIWSMYERHFPSKKVSMYYWTGESLNLCPEYPIHDVKNFYMHDLVDRLEDIVNNLEKEKDKVPGLIIAHHDELDMTGHLNIKNETAMNEVLQKLDDEIDAFINKLYQKGILDCINLVIVSDHGMQPISVKVDISKHFVPEDSKNFFISNNTIGSVHNISASQVPRFYDQLACKIPNVTVYNKKTIPTRKHYSSHRYIGDLILEGNPGVTFGEPPEKRQGDHGYDFVQKNMHAIFVGRGPSFKKGVIVEPFQNVQLMNLWIDLLGLPEKEKEKNDGTIGFFNQILTKPRKIDIDKTPRIAECKKLSNISTPTGCDKQEPKPIDVVNCKNTGPRLALLSSNDNFCYETYCQDNIVKHKTVETPLTVSEALDPTDLVKNMSFYEADYLSNNESTKCEKKLAKGWYSISVRKNLVDSFVQFDELFNEKVLKPLNALTNQYLTDFKTIHVISGTTIDENYDGRLDKGGWRTVSPPKCMKPKRMQTLSFIFPIATPKAWNCITSDQLLKDYTATIIDVERITGFRFQIEQTTPQVNTNIRQRITEEFWKIDDFKKEEDSSSGLPNIIPLMIFVLGFVMYFY